MDRLVVFILLGVVSFSSIVNAKVTECEGTKIRPEYV
jgi:hypothetical protein